MEKTKFLTIKDVATILRISERQIRSLCLTHLRGEEGGLRSGKLRSKWLVAESDLDEFIENMYPRTKRR